MEPVFKKSQRESDSSGFSLRTNLKFIPDHVCLSLFIIKRTIEKKENLNYAYKNLIVYNSKWNMEWINEKN